MIIEDLCNRYPFTEEEIEAAYHLLDNSAKMTEIVCSVATNIGKKPIDIASFAFESRCVSPEVVEIGEYIAREHG